MDHIYMKILSTSCILLVLFSIIDCKEVGRLLGNASGHVAGENGLELMRQNKRSLRLGLIMPYLFYCGSSCSESTPKFTGDSYAAAFKIAVDEINRNRSLLPNHYVEFVYNDSRLLEFNTIKAFYHQLNRMNVTALVGFGWFCSSIAPLAAAAKVSLISYTCLENDVAEFTKESEREGPLFIRTDPLIAQVIPNLVAVLEHFKWSNIALIRSAEINAFQLEKNLKIAEEFQRYGINILCEEELPVSYHVEDTNYTRAMFRKVIQSVKGRCKILVFMSTFIVVREALIAAHQLGITNGDYVFIVPIMSPVTFEDYNRYPFKWLMSAYKYTLSSEAAVKEAFKMTLLVGLTINKDDASVRQFAQRLKDESAKPPYNSTYYLEHPTASIPDNAYYLYDSVLLYAIAANKTLSKNEDITLNHNIYKNLNGTAYQSILGHKLSVHGRARQGLHVRYNYKVYMAEQNGDDIVMQHKGDIMGNNATTSENKTDFVYVKVRKITWLKGLPPRDTFSQEKAIEDNEDTLVISLSVSIALVVVILVILPVFKYRNYRLEQSLNSKLWEINVDELEFNERCVSPAISTANLENPEIHVELTPQRKKSFKVSTAVASYKLEWVAVKAIEGHPVELKREIYLELNQMREIRHDNINHFIGAYIRPGRTLIVSQFALRGSLEDVLEDNDIKLETLFLLSLIYDITKGMSYLHSTEFRSHGSLKSSNCVIDSRWVLKITDFGLHSLKGKKAAKEYRDLLDYRSQLWIAPELLRDTDAPPQGTAKGDVYSFAIILQECHTRRGPWSDVDLSCEEIVSRVENVEDPPFRPVVPAIIKNADELQSIMLTCWNENPQNRPSFLELTRQLDSMMKANGMKSNLVDNMAYMMEQYTGDLESLVEKKNGLLSIEKKRIETLLEMMLPKTVLKQLKQGKEVEAETFDEVTIYFSDIAGFTSLCAESTAMEVVQFLNDLYTMFDGIIKYYDVYKVETIGDAYMVVSGLPIRNGKDHAKEISLMALHLRNAVKTFVIRHRRNKQLRVRIGIHSGSVVTGVVGSTMPRYCLFGDAVNTASRMESTGEPLKIHVSESTKEILDGIGGFQLRLRGDLPVKGKGVLTTYWLDEAGEKWLPTLMKYQNAESLRVQTAPKTTPQSVHIQQQQHLTRSSPANSLCPSPTSSPTLLRKGSRYRCRKEANLELDINHKMLSRTNSKNTPVEETGNFLPTA